MRFAKCTSFAVAASLLLLVAPSPAEFKTVAHRPVAPGAIAVDSPGSYAKAGATYVLTRDIKSATSPIFLGNNVTLDLNGYTITYAADAYEHLPNYGFEDGAKAWDFTKAPGAAILETEKVKPFIGRKILRLPQGGEIVSPYIKLPVANRSYYAMCGVLSHQMKVRVSIEDEAGREVRCEFRWDDRIRPTCPQEGSPKLGGGFVFAHLHHQPASRYRVRVKALDRDALIDEVDLRPALDVGVGIVEKTYPWAYFRCIHDGDFCAFFDYSKPGSFSEPAAGVPRVTGAGTVTIRNGFIQSGFAGIRSWGLMSTAPDVTVKLENVRFAAAGINTNAVSAYTGDLRDCRFEIDTPFIIDRHRFDDSPVALRGAAPSRVSHCEFIGGQGCLNVNGNESQVHDNLFVNRQTVTNHYSLMLGGGARGVKIFRNRFEPEIGSGITMFRVKDCEIYENTFKIVAANGNCEYTNEDYSTNAIRITDYNAEADSERGATGNRIHHNRFHITGRMYDNYPRCIPIATAIFCSVGAGKNFVHDNDITVEHESPESKAVAHAFYVTGSRIGGEYYGNKITTNVPAFWIGAYYGAASNVLVRENTITKSAGALAKFQPFRLGYGGYDNYQATAVRFERNRFVNCEFGIEASEGRSEYTRAPAAEK